MTSQPMNNSNVQYAGNVPQQGIQGQSNGQVQQQQASVQQQVPQQVSVPQSKGKNRILTVALLIAIIIAGIGGGFFYYQNYYVGDTGDQGVLGVYDSNAYHAVFMNNGNVYFGHVSSKNPDAVVLTDTHFLQVSQNPVQQQQQAVLNEEGEEVIQAQAQPQVQPELSIVKRANTLHSPDGTIEINMTNVMFIEKLTADSQVIEAINQLDEQPNK